MSRERRRLQRFGTVRVRMTLAAMGVVAVTLGVGAMVLVTVLRSSLTNDLTNAATLRAHDVARLIESGQSPAALRLDSTDASIVQVISSKGKVLASGHDIEDSPPIVTHPLSKPTTIVDVDADERQAFRVVTEQVHGPNGPVLVVAAQSLDPVNDSVSQVARLLVQGFPAIVALVGAIAWMVTGRALRPVESIRKRAAAISDTDLGQRMPVPDGDDEIARLARTLNDMLGRLQHSRGVQRQFLADASHELRSPLATIIHRLDLARTHGDAVTMEALLEDLGPEAERMQLLVEGLLDLARADSHTADTRSNVGPVDVEELVFREAKRLRSVGAVRVDTSEVSPCRISGDAVGLGRVVRNLADNAARHASSTVVFTLGATEGWMELTVGDDGPGVPFADRERVFDRFVRLDESRTRSAGGSGLGLSIVQTIVTTHGGRVEVDDRDGGGAVFHVHLPIVEP